MGDGETPCSIVRVRAVLVEGVRIPAGGSGPMRPAQPGPAWGAPVRATGGTGLGLAIVKHVATNHGGEVSVWSREGSGSTFTLRLPPHAGASAAPSEGEFA